MVAVTVWPDWVTVPFHALVIRWSPGKVNVRAQPLIVLVPALVIVTLATNPFGHWLEVV